MKILLLITIFTLQLFALNPKIYATLGDKLYNNLDNIKALQHREEFKEDVVKIKEYIFSVKALKGVGFNIDRGDFSVTKQEYLDNLRALAKTNDYFVVKIKQLFFNSIDQNNSELFLFTVKSNLLDTTRYKSDIKKYYYAHKDEIDIEGSVIEKFVQEDEKKKKPKPVYKGPTKEELQRAKIEEIRAKDKARQEALAKSLEEELKKKKEMIRKEQEKELITK